MFELAPGSRWIRDDRSVSLRPTEFAEAAQRRNEFDRTGARPRICSSQASSARGRKLWVRVIMKAERRSGQITRLHGTVQDVTDLVNAERQLRETRDFLDLTLNAAPMPIAYVSQEGKGVRVVRYANKAMEAWLGRTRAEMIGKLSRDVFSADSIAIVQPRFRKLERARQLQVRLQGMRAGAARDWQNYFVPQLGPDRRSFWDSSSIVYDMTEQKRLEARLLQAQKMEAIGQLTGGIAHDFNNLLGVVIGNLQLLERSVAETPPLARKVHTAMRAAVRGADLTRRLLAFARRQILDPAVLDLNRQLTSLQRSHAAHSRRVDRSAHGAGARTVVDARGCRPIRERHPQSRDQRARCDAERRPPDGAYAECRAGCGVLRRASLDRTGRVRFDHASQIPASGMEPEVLKRVFEPFFTTKESGKGSGLGLAMVHGFAEQAGGLATDRKSARPRHDACGFCCPAPSRSRLCARTRSSRRSAPGGTETILVVEDDADLRETVVTTLTQLGYRALAADNAAAALRILAGPESIDLLFTDVMMPGGVLGPALAKRARELRPEINVLFTTGYAETTVLAGAAGVTAAEVITKPYRNEDLATRIRYVLDREARVA